jgi:hypothetical protein
MTASAALDIIRLEQALPRAIGNGIVDLIVAALGVGHSLAGPFHNYLLLRLEGGELRQVDDGLDVCLGASADEGD